jgi:hypothetical protein
MVHHAEFIAVKSNFISVTDKAAYARGGAAFIEDNLFDAKLQVLVRLADKRTRLVALPSLSFSSFHLNNAKKTYEWIFCAIIAVYSATVLWTSFLN